jgi:ferredoxin
MNAEVLTERCEGHGLCESTSPDVYRLDDEGFANVLVNPIPAALEASAQAGARVCPVVAIRINDAVN